MIVCRSRRGVSLRCLFMVLPSCTILAILGVFHASKRVDQRAHGFVGCLHVGYSLMGSMGSALMTVTITVFCGFDDSFS
ncbi:putative secreted protein [Corynebacterium diphtheriae 31A]|nr:putative secreted protein [Corynebacterium diphtheriae 31A]